MIVFRSVVVFLVVFVACGHAVNVKDFGAIGNGYADDTDAVIEGMRAAAMNNTFLVFPSGVFRVTRDIPFCAMEGQKCWTASLYGSANEASILFSENNVAIREEGWSTRFSTIPTIDNLIFVGVRIRLRGPYKIGMVISRTIFASLEDEGPPPDPDASGIHQSTPDESVLVSFNNIRGGLVTQNLFLSARSNAGSVPLGCFSCGDLHARDNVVGWDLGNSGWLDGNFSPFRSWSQLPSYRLSEMLSRLPVQLPRRLGHFQRGFWFYNDAATTYKTKQSTEITGNLVNRDIDSKARIDHAMYIWGFKNIKIQDNFMRGWPQTGKGGLKLRNGENAILCGNYFEATPLLLYTYDVTNAPRILRNVTVCANIFDYNFDFFTNIDPVYYGVLHYRNFVAASDSYEDSPERQNVFINNTFDHPQRFRFETFRGNKPADVFHQSKPSVAVMFSLFGNVFSDGQPATYSNMLPVKTLPYPLNECCRPATSIRPPPYL